MWTPRLPGRTARESSVAAGSIAWTARWKRVSRSPVSGVPAATSARISSSTSRGPFGGAGGGVAAAASGIRRPIVTAA